MLLLRCALTDNECDAGVKRKSCCRFRMLSFQTRGAAGEAGTKRQEMTRDNRRYRHAGIRR
jgi:hypothetical protein